MQSIKMYKYAKQKKQKKEKKSKQERATEGRAKQEKGPRLMRR